MTQSSQLFIFLCILTLCVTSEARSTGANVTKAAGKKVESLDNPFVGTLPITENLFSGLSKDQINEWMEKINYALYGAPIAFLLQYTLVYAYAYFVVYSSKWILSELNRGGDLNNPVMYSTVNKMSPPPFDWSVLEKVIKSSQAPTSSITSQQTQYDWNPPSAGGTVPHKSSFNVDSQGQYSGNNVNSLRKAYQGYDLSQQYSGNYAAQDNQQWQKQNLGPDSQ